MPEFGQVNIPLEQNILNGGLSQPTDNRQYISTQQTNQPSTPSTLPPINISNIDWVKARVLENPLNTKLSDSVRFNRPEFGGFNPYWSNPENLYGDQQSTGEKVKNNILKFGANAVGAFVEGIATIPIVLGAAATVNFSTLYNNPITNAITEATDKIENDLPNYESSYVTQNPFLAYVNPFQFGSFLDRWSGVVKNLGYTAGAIGTALVTDGMTIGPALERLTLLKLAKLSKVINSSDDLIRTYTTLINEGKPIEKALESAYKTAKITNGVRYGANLFISSVSEGSIEANNIYKETKQSLIDNYKQKTGIEPDSEVLSKIEDYSTSAGNVGLIGNVALLAVTNSLSLGSLLKPTQVAIDAVENAATRTLRVAEKNPNLIESFVEPQSKLKALLKTTIGSPESLLRTNLVEGVEEGGQFFIQKSTEDYYKRKFDNDSVDTVDNLTASLGKGLKEVLLTREGQENILAGFLGGVAIHGLKNISNKVRGVPTVQQSRERALGELNKYTLTGLFSQENNLTKNYDGAVISASIQKDMQKALEKGDIFEYKNLKHQMLFNFVNSAIGTDRFDLRIEQLNVLKDLNENNFKTLFNMEYSSENKKTVNEYVDSVITKAESIKDSIEQVNYIFKNQFNSKKDSAKYQAFEYYKSQLALSISENKDNRQRMESLGTEIGQILPTANIDSIGLLTTEKGIEELQKKFSQKIATLKQNEENSKGNEELQNKYKKERYFLEAKIKEFNKELIHSKQTVTENNITASDDYINTLMESLDYFNNIETPTTSKIITQLDTLQTYNKLQDIVKLGDNTKRAYEYYDKLVKKEGYENFILDYLKEFQPYEDKIHIDKDGNFSLKEDNQEEVDTEKTDVVSKDDIDNTLAKIKEGDKETIARQLDKYYEDNPESKAAKIAKGEIEPTEEDVEEARDRALNDFRIAEEERTKPRIVEVAEKDKPIDLKETYEQRKERTKNTVDKEEEKPYNEKQDTNAIEKSSSATLIEVFSRMRTNIIKFMNRLYVGDESLSKEDLAEKGFIDWNENLQTLLRSTTSKKEIEEQIYSKIEIKNDDNVAKKKELSYVTVFYFDENGNKKLFKNLFREKGKQTNLVVYVGKTAVGTLQSPLLFKRGNDYLPSSRMTVEEYTNITGNETASYTGYIIQAKAYEKAYRDIENKGLNKTTENKDVRNIFNLVTTYGRLLSTNKADEATLIKDLNYNKTGNILISTPLKLVNGRYERDTPQILTKNLSKDTEEQIVKFLQNDHVLKTIENLDGSYYYILRMPDGSYSTSQSLLRARPKTENYDKLDDFVTLVKEALLEPDGVSSKEINDTLRNQVYIANRISGKLQRTYLSFKTEGKTLIFNVNNRGFRGIKNIEIKIQDTELSDIDNIDDFLTLLNDKIKSTLTRDQQEQLKLVIKKEDFKVNISDKQDAKSLESTLTVPIAANVFGNMRLNFIAKPEGGQSNVVIETKTVQNKTVTTLVEDGNVKGVTITKNETIQPTEKADIERRRQELEDYFKEKTKSTQDTKYNPELSGEGDLALREKENELLALGGENIQAHGFTKGSIGQQFKDLLNILINGLDKNRTSLYTAPLVLSEENRGVASAMGTSGGTAYMDGGFIIIGNKGSNSITSLDDIGGVLVNQAVADTLPELVQRLKESFPNLIVESYKNSPKALQEINAKYDAELAAAKDKVVGSGEVENISEEETQPNQELEIKGTVVDDNLQSIITQLKNKSIITTDC